MWGEVGASVPLRNADTWVGCSCWSLAGSGEQLHGLRRLGNSHDRPTSSAAAGATAGHVLLAYMGLAGMHSAAAASHQHCLVPHATPECVHAALVEA